MNDINWKDTPPIAGMTPWACSYTGQDGRTYGITLYGTDAKKVLEDNCSDLPGLRVDGELVAIGRRKSGEHD